MWSNFFLYQNGARSTSANFDFGQLFFRVRPIRLRPISTSANFWMLNFLTTKGGAPKGGGPNLEKVGSRSLGPRRVGPEGWGPKFRSFFPLPPQFSFFSHSLVGPFVEFWWCQTEHAQIRHSCSRSQHGHDLHNAHHSGVHF